MSKIDVQLAIISCGVSGFVHFVQNVDGDRGQEQVVFSKIWGVEVIRS